MAANNEKPTDKNEKDGKPETNDKKEFTISSTTSLRASDPKDPQRPK